MAITITNTLLPLYFSRNAADIEFTAPDKVLTAGKKARQRITFSSYPADGDTLKVEFTVNGVDYSRTFTFKTSPDINAYEIELYPGTGLNDWLLKVIEGLMSDYDIARFFAFEFYNLTSPNGINIYAQYQDDTAPTFTATGFSINLSLLLAGSTPEYRSNYRLSAWLYIGIANDATGLDFYRTGEIELDTDSLNHVRLNLHRYLDAYMATPEYPTTFTGIYTICRKINVPAYILFGQKWNDPYERQKQFTSPTFRVLRGGMEPRRFAALKPTLASSVAAEFLTLRTERMISFDGQQDWLFFFCTGKYTDLRCHVKAYHTNSGPTDHDVITASTAPNTTYQFRADFAALIAALPNSDTIYMYKVWLVDGSTGLTITNTITFRDDADYLDLIFQYENSLGGIESWKMKGERSVQHKLTKAGYTHPMPFEADQTARTLETYAEINTVSLACTTGPTNPTDAAAFPDFLLSRYVWLIHNGTRIPVRIPEGEAIARSWNLTADYSRGGAFTAEISQSPNVSGDIF